MSSADQVVMLGGSGRPCCRRVPVSPKQWGLQSFPLWLSAATSDASTLDPAWVSLCFTLAHHSVLHKQVDRSMRKHSRWHRLTLHSSSPPTVSQHAPQDKRMHPAHICVWTSQVDVSKRWSFVFMWRLALTSARPALTITSVFVSDRVGRSTAAPVEEETAAGTANASQRRGRG